MSGADQAIPTDAMDLDSREEGELSNGEMEMDVINSEGQQHPHSVQEQPPAESQQSTDDNNDRPWSKDNIGMSYCGRVLLLLLIAGAQHLQPVNSNP